MILDRDGDDIFADRAARARRGVHLGRSIVIRIRKI
jgi:hypothetical protein